MMTCYCKTNEAETTTAITNANNTVAELSHMIEEMTAKKAAPSAEIEGLNSEIAPTRRGSRRARRSARMLGRLCGRGEERDRAER